MKTLLVCAALVLGTLGFGANPQAIYKSQGALVGALEGGVGEGELLAEAQYIPGYGLHIAMGGYEEFVKQAQNRIPDILKRLSTQIKGLDSQDWISVGFVAGYDNTHTEIVFRMKQGKPETLEVIQTLPVQQAKPKKR